MIDTAIICVQNSRIKGRDKTVNIASLHYPGFEQVEK